MIALRPPVRTFEQVKALAASGSSSFARKAQEELKARTNAGLRAALRQGGEGAR